PRAERVQPMKHTWFATALLVGASFVMPSLASAAEDGHAKAHELTDKKGDSKKKKKSSKKKKGDKDKPGEAGK
ncbi:MAG TPA: hypothetical protein VGP93_18540, partial [Polyangiaceae bacterium]|nr:hypothetical protein [Polyangiaceae bacterium]